MSVPPPPPASVPPPPIPTAPNVTDAKSGGVLLDMGSLFGGGGTKKNAIPPWERRGKSAPDGSKGGAKTSPPKSSTCLTAIPVPAAADITGPSQKQGASSASPSPSQPPPMSGVNRDSSPLGSSSPSPAPAAPLGGGGGGTGTGAISSALPNSVLPAPSSAAALEPPPQASRPDPHSPPPTSTATAAPVSAVPAASTQPQSVLPQQQAQPPPQQQPPAPTAPGSTTAPPPPVQAADQTVIASAASPGTAGPGQPAVATGGPAVAGTSASPSSPPPPPPPPPQPSVVFLQMPPTLHTVVKPLQMYYQGEAQHRVVPPIRRRYLDAAVTRSSAAVATHAMSSDTNKAQEGEDKAKKTTKKTVANVAASKRAYWRNTYDLQPSPSAPYTATNTLAVCVDTASTTVLRERLGYASTTTASTALSSSRYPKSRTCNSAETTTAVKGTSRCASCRPRAAAATEAWRQPYFEHLDVHRYIARRYFGTPPPVEQ